ncbi:threonine dehydratase [Pontibacillus halophilus JSM 076056 = DSM 19796]|uniref:Threonine dehydratase n=1 Tax=Pontibacillus halophilus JSM 076056 = DSM 19796 TaxID=1385510 RepID=A0A0A5GMT1_9BACI|nr:hypothetical protein [Pontibacillus halophilus]KGX92465.1 threonine dehydratase [Pontibacillus halophilus JSM 076056 = DSM 19796]
MDYYLKSKEGAYPCEITIDEDNGRYMIKKEDTSGEIFNTAQELIHWLENNWNREQFVNDKYFDRMMKELHEAYSTEIHVPPLVSKQ